MAKYHDHFLKCAIMLKRVLGPSSGLTAINLFYFSVQYLLELGFDIRKLGYVSLRKAQSRIQHNLVYCEVESDIFKHTDHQTVLDSTGIV